MKALIKLYTRLRQTVGRNCRQKRVSVTHPARPSQLEVELAPHTAVTGWASCGLGDELWASLGMPDRALPAGSFHPRPSLLPSATERCTLVRVPPAAAAALP